MKMFLAGPFKALVDPETGEMPETAVNLYADIIDHFETRGWVVHCAHKREEWGRAFMPPHECTRVDYDEIAACDVFVAFPGSPASPGTHIELGWASAIGKPIVMLLEDSSEYAFLVRGLDAVTPIAHVGFSGNRVDPAAIEQGISRLGVQADHAQ
jgi:nucleoside 2-deoxyribosyltransferase